MNAMHVCARNMEYSDWGDHMVNLLNADRYVCVSVDRKKDNLVRVPLPTKPRDTGNLHQVLNNKVGA